MPKFFIKYYFDGNGEVEIDAKNENEAREKFFSGEFAEHSEQEWGDSYNIETITKK